MPRRSGTSEQGLPEVAIVSFLGEVGFVGGAVDVHGRGALLERQAAIWT